METLDSSIFDLTPIPMWIEDFSEVKQLFDLWRNQGVENLYEFLSQNENLVVECAHKIKIIKVNQKVSVHDKFHRTLILSGFCLLKIAKISL
ncbi:hypothetical protein ACXP6O_16190, partial [Acinetobacter baumannii]